MILNLITNKKDFKKYEGEGVQVLLTFDNDILTNMTLKSTDKYLPKIFPVFDNDDYKVIDFKIETKGSGTFYKDEMKKIVVAYKKAINIVDELEKLLKN